MVLIQDHIDIQYKSFVINGIAQPYGIGNDYRRNICFLHMQQLFAVKKKNICQKRPNNGTVLICLFLVMYISLYNVLYEQGCLYKNELRTKLINFL